MSETKRRYRRTVLGPFWNSVTLLLFVGLMSGVYSQLLSHESQTYSLYVCAGMMLWMFLTANLQEGGSVFFSQANLITQLPFNKFHLIFATVWRNTIVLAHNFLVFVAIFALTGGTLSWTKLLAIPNFALLVLIMLPWTMILGIVCARFRDVQQIVGNLLTIGIFVTPVFWQSNRVTGAANFAATANPLYHLIQLVRSPLLGEVPSGFTYAYACGLGALGWVIAMLMYQKLRHRIVFWL